MRHFSEQARIIVDNIRSRDKLPIIVGGTHYYVQSMLPADTLMQDQPSVTELESLSSSKWPILNAPTSEMLEELRVLDPEMALRWHPNDRRKIQRSLEICLQNGRPASQIYSEQKVARDKALDHPHDGAEVPCFNDLLVLWTHARSSDLNARLDQRVDAMIEQGLVGEVEAVFKSAEARRAQGTEIDESHGIWTAIGYKEFLPLVTHHQGAGASKEDCTERTKVSTRQYAKRQTRWLRLKLMPTLVQAGYGKNTFVLDASELVSWDALVRNPALEITKSFIDGAELPQPDLFSPLAAELLQQTEKPLRVAHYCHSCDKTLMTVEEWNGHLESRAHRNATRPKTDWKAIHSTKANSNG